MNNLYYQKTNHLLARPVNDKSVLENYHSYLLFNILDKDQNDILTNLTATEKIRFRKATIEAVMGTDMMGHFALCNAFEKVIQKLKEGTFDKNNTDDKDVRAKKLIIFHLDYSKDHSSCF